MNPRSLAALVAVNAALLAALVVTLFSPEPARAQLGAGPQYLMVAGPTTGGSERSLIYVIDQRSSALVTLMFHSANNDLQVVAGRRIGDDLQSAPTVRR